MTELIQRTEEWIKLRKNKIGASDAPVIMGISPWKTPYQLWEEKLGLRQSQEMTSSMKRGLDLEDHARECFHRKLNIFVFPEVMFHNKYDWMMASLDGIDAEKKNIVEIKCANREDHQIAISGKLPEKYYPQLQHQLEVTGLEMAYYFSFDGEDGVVVEVGRNNEYINEMINEEKKFWSCMQDFVAPKMSSRDYVERSNEEWTTVSQEWLLIQTEMDKLKKREDNLKQRLIEMSQGQNAVGGGVKLSKTVRKGEIDYSSIPALKGKNLEMYRKSPVEFWRLSREKRPTGE